MRNVIFVAPFAFKTTSRFAEAAARHPDTRLVLLSRDPVERFPRPLRERLGGHWRVGNALDPETLVVAVAAIRRRLGPIHAVLATLEQLQEPLAMVRERLGLPGMTLEVARRLRDPAGLAAALREAGAAPRQDGDPGNGFEHSFDGVMVDGRMVWHSLIQTLPPPREPIAEDRRAGSPWRLLLPRESGADSDVDSDVDSGADSGVDSGDVARMATAAFQALGLVTGVCHLEWRRRADGTLAVSEIGARPGGAWISKLISYAYDTSFYRTWAQVMIDGAFEPPEARYAAGAVFLRGGAAKISRSRVDELRLEELGDLVVETNLPSEPGSSHAPEEGYVILRHPETATVREALGRFLELVGNDG